VAGCIISIRPTYSYAAALTYLLTHSHSWLGRIKPAISPPKYMTLNDLCGCARFKVIDSLNAAKMAKYSLLMTPMPSRVAGCIISVRRIHIHALVHLLTYTVGSGRKNRQYINS